MLLSGAGIELSVVLSTNRHWLMEIVLRSIPRCSSIHQNIKSRQGTIVHSAVLQFRTASSYTAACYGWHLNGINSSPTIGDTSESLVKVTNMVRA
jgi:hypothetical protein